MTPFVAAVLCFGAMLALYSCYEAEKYRGNRNRTRELALKGGTTCMAALLAGYGYALHSSLPHLFLLLGLCVCAVADVILDLHFLAGTAAFGLGHLCYCAAYLWASPPGVVSLVLFFLLAAVLLLLYPRLKRFAAPESALPYLLYGLLISAMLSLALPQKPLLFAGALLFVVSDTMLLLRIIRKIPSKVYDYLCLGAYFLAQFLIAASTVYKTIL